MKLVDGSLERGQHGIEFSKFSNIDPNDNSLWIFELISKRFWQWPKNVLEKFIFNNRDCLSGLLVAYLENLFYWFLSHRIDLIALLPTSYLRASYDRYFSRKRLLCKKVYESYNSFNSFVIARWFSKTWIIYLLKNESKF